MLPLLLLLTVAAQNAGTRPPNDLPVYWRAATEYRSGDRQRALREIRRWRTSEILDSIESLRHESDRRQKVAVRAGETMEVPVQVDFRTVEAAALMHVEAGLLELQSLGIGSAQSHFAAATSLVEWSHALAKERLERLARLEEAEDSKEEPDPVRLETHRRALSVELGIDTRGFYVALAAATLAAGFPEAALPFAERAKGAAPRDGEALLIDACVKESLAHRETVGGRARDARGLREEAEASFREALAVDPALTEARLRLGRVLLAEGRPDEAVPLLHATAEEATGREQLYLALLLLGRASELGASPGDAALLYRRALEAWPDSQAARLALARSLEVSAGPFEARPLVMASLLDSRDPAREADPWWSYPFGPQGLAKVALDRLWQVTLGRSFGS